MAGMDLLRDPPMAETDKDHGTLVEMGLVTMERDFGLLKSPTTAWTSHHTRIEA